VKLGKDSSGTCEILSENSGEEAMKISRAYV
jgi:hypothetical protein